MTTPNPLWIEFIKAVKHEVIPALGCTEPISLALACAIAREQLGSLPEHIDAKVSANLMKNGMGVTVPGTGMVGLAIAAAVGATGGDPQGGLQVLKNMTPEQVAAGKAMLDAKQVSVSIADVPNILYSEATLSAHGEHVRVCIADAHTNVVLIEKNGATLWQAPVQDRTQGGHYSLTGARMHEVYEFANRVPLGEITFILEAARLNSALADEGMTGQYGLHIGATLQRQIKQGLLSQGLLTEILIRTTAASDARMGGATLPAMSNSGSGNQGIAATLPVLVVARHLNASDEKLTRALILSHLTAIYIHSKLPALSALCAVTTASMGAAAGMAWLLDGKEESVGMAICSMVGDLAGMICDGASNSCAMKVSTSASSAYKSVLMALDDSRVTGNEGIVAHDVDESIDNLCALASRSMRETDRQVIEIMVQKAR
ncbi:L-cysteine desulfidase family protein [Craterilacuibacter sp.]|uniref:L-cysteine desulfidase family protein n=1 Tax=Craterilacuibacter sp. TaxID=2870909 RepID=UPI003F3B715E